MDDDLKKKKQTKKISIVDITKEIEFDRENHINDLDDVEFKHLDSTDAE